MRRLSNVYRSAFVSIMNIIIKNKINKFVKSELKNYDSNFNFINSRVYMSLQLMISHNLISLDNGCYYTVLTRNKEDWDSVLNYIGKEEINNEEIPAQFSMQQENSSIAELRFILNDVNRKLDLLLRVAAIPSNIIREELLKPINNTASLSGN